MNEYLVWGLIAVVLILLWRSLSAGSRLKDLSERHEDLLRRVRDFERRHEQDLDAARNSMKMEIDSALHKMDKKTEDAAADPEKAKVIEAIRTVYDPEIPVNVYDLGLIYDIGIEGDKAVKVTMSLTSESCPSAKEIPANIEKSIRDHLPYEDVSVDVVWEPKWGPHMISDEGKQKLGLVQ